MNILSFRNSALWGLLRYNIHNKINSKEVSMASKFFEIIITRQIETFVKTFADDSSSLFKNEHDKLIHPGEYGMYKERCLRTLLQSVLPKNYNISDGFIITSCDNHISTQCDLLIYNANTMPLTDDGVGKFFPVEDVFGVVEVKSTLSKKDFIKALQKLADIKKLSDDRTKMLPTSNSNYLHYYQIPTFLVCNKLSFDINSIDFENEVYKNYDKKYWHNAILSLEDGLIRYALVFSEFPPKTKERYKTNALIDSHTICAFQYALHVTYFEDATIETYCCPIDFSPVNHEDKYQHIIEFLSVIKQTVHSCIKYEFDSMIYLGMNVE